MFALCCHALSADAVPFYLSMYLFPMSFKESLSSCAYNFIDLHLAATISACGSSKIATLELAGRKDVALLLSCGFTSNSHSLKLVCFK